MKWRDFTTAKATLPLGEDGNVLVIKVLEL